MITKSYSKYNRINYTTILRSGESYDYHDKHCLEEIKFNYLKKEKVILFFNSSNIDDVYPKEVRDRWLNLVKTNFNFKFNYVEEVNKHSIELIYSDFDTIIELYLCLLLLRYLWYTDNNNLIYRIFDIMDNSNLNFFDSLKLAHFYDDIRRNDVFNLFNSIYIPLYYNKTDFITLIKNETNIQNSIVKVLGTLNIEALKLLRFYLRTFKLSEKYDVEYEKLYKLYKSFIYDSNIKKIQYSKVLAFCNLPNNLELINNINDLKINDTILIYNMILKIKSILYDDSSITSFNCVYITDDTLDYNFTVINSELKRYEIYKIL